MKRILLVEPAYKNKYPPLGLMKISQYHKQKGDHVEFIKGTCPEKRDKYQWNRIYISSLFTYDWAETIKTIKFYRFSVKEPATKNLIIGGIIATLLSDEIIKEVACKVVIGLLNENGKIGYKDDGIIDCLAPDYSILDNIDYEYPINNAYFLYTTRGCIRKCDFCAVHQIEPTFNNFIEITEQIEIINNKYGEKKDLLLLDNNVLASNRFTAIIDMIKKVGFTKGAKIAYRAKNGQQVIAQRWVDFNQGVDARLLDESKMALISEIAINPLRIAFDSISYKELYIEKIRLAAKHGIYRLSNYVLFNFEDHPDDFYERLKINLELNQELELQIFSFPMRYINITSKSRSVDSPGNLGAFWNKKYLRAIQVVLHATRGLVGTRIDFFHKAFGENIEEYRKILMMPEDYIMNRLSHERDGSAEEWWRSYNSLTTSEKEVIDSIIFTNSFNQFDFNLLSKKTAKVLEHYLLRD